MTVRLVVFAVCLIGLLTWEARRPARSPDRRRWAGNFALGALDTVLLRLVVAGGLTGVAAWGQAAGTGVADGWPAVAVGLPALDLAVYVQHRLLHRWSWLWRWHRVHHTDRSVDVSTALRFHPVEAVLSLAIKAAVVLAIGVPPAGVLAFELWLSTCALFNHTNTRLPPAAEWWLRRALITPDLHRIHHSVRQHEHNRNFGFSVCWWDRLFGSWCPQAHGGHGALRLGLTDRAAPRRLIDLLAEPFRGAANPTRPPTPETPP